MMKSNSINPVKYNVEKIILNSVSETSLCKSQFNIKYFPYLLSGKNAKKFHMLKLVSFILFHFSVNL